MPEPDAPLNLLSSRAVFFCFSPAHRRRFVQGTALAATESTKVQTRRADYKAIAPKYDKNADRLRIPRDEGLASILAEASGRAVTVLDVGCGTGNYLAVQRSAFSDANVRWIGVDPSDAMLSRARSKLPRVELLEGRAEDLPLAPGEADFVANSFAFHHFENKARALDEMVRVLAPAGAIHLRNIAPSYMPGWWLYRFFPTAWPIDQERFWPPQRLFTELAQRGLCPEVRVEFFKAYVSIRDIRADVERRDISELAVIDEAAYLEGLARVHARAQLNPDERGPSEIALVDVVASRRGTQLETHWP